MAQFPHICRGSIVPAHSNQQRHGRGACHKADDFLIAAVCQVAHDLIDGRSGGWTKEEKQSEWDRAHVATWRWFWENEKVVVNKEAA